MKILNFNFKSYHWRWTEFKLRFFFESWTKIGFSCNLKGNKYVYNQTPYYRSVDTIEFSKVHLKFVMHRRMLFLVYRTYQTHDTFPQYWIIVTGVAAILLLFNSKIYISLVGDKVYLARHISKLNLCSTIAKNLQTSTSVRQKSGGSRL